MVARDDDQSAPPNADGLEHTLVDHFPDGTDAKPTQAAEFLDRCRDPISDTDLLYKGCVSGRKYGRDRGSIYCKN
jgi:bisphosphoglycerate-independent phosphoglycerate mutase (AlkP superfamily)